MSQNGDAPRWVGALVRVGGDGCGGVQLVLQVSSSGWGPTPNPAADPARLAREVARLARADPAVRRHAELAGQLHGVLQALAAVNEDLARVGADARDALANLCGGERLREAAAREAGLLAERASLQVTGGELRRQLAEARRLAEWVVVDRAADAVRGASGHLGNFEQAVARFLSADGVSSALCALAADLRTPAPDAGAVARLAQREVLGDAPQGPGAGPDRPAPGPGPLEPPRAPGAPAPALAGGGFVGQRLDRPPGEPATTAYTMDPATGA